MVRPITRRAFLFAAALGLGAAAGLASTSPLRGRPGRPDDQRLRLGDLTLLVRASPWQLSLVAPDGRLVWQEPADLPLTFGTTDGRTLSARRLTGVQRIADGGIHLIAETDDPGAALVVEVHHLGDRAFRLTVTPDATTDVTWIQGAAACAADEHFVGLGERFDSVDQRGRIVDVWAEDRRVANYGASTYAPLPLVFSSRGYAVALERFERCRFDLAATHADRWTWRQDARSVSLVISYGPDLRDLVQQNVARTGLPPLPPVWLFGVWKTSVGGQQRVLDELQQLRSLNVPISAVFSYDAVDLEANLGWPSVTFGGREAGSYLDHQQFTSALHANGAKALNYFTADFHLDRSNYTEPSSHGFLIRRPDGRVYVHPSFKVAWLDYSDPDTAVWWAASWQRALTVLGYDGGMLDLGELIPADALFADGSTGLQSHNRYPLLYAQAAWEGAHAVRPDGDIAVILRSAARGAQRFASGQWNGDAVMRWTGPDGLQSMIPAALSLGLSGFPYWHAEVAGYVQADLSHDAERELWLRWLQLATWTALLRDHLGDHPRSPIDVWSDEGTTQAFRLAARVHASLVPYLYSLAAEASRGGLPLMRYVALDCPEDPRAWTENQAYFLGPTFLVAPVVEPGATSRTVYLPRGEWVDFWRGTLYDGQQQVTVPAPLDGAGPPVFARAGAIVPLAAEHDTLVRSSSADVRTWTGDLMVRIMPRRASSASESSFTLYDGTVLRWTGSQLVISNNPQPRGIELRGPDGAVKTVQLTSSSAAL